ncbi:Ddx54 [Symbiodinium necroappetens]|uniref:RNA helicase n=1 Tax=Symbiodinium necroappetens TaxID=1628268 RepID=A0A812RTL0_9DINO|nr:Ddx54 [Symbiodinium necroappetens]
MAPARNKRAGAMAKVKATGDKEEPGSQKKVKKAKPGSFQGLGLSPPVFKAIMRLGYKVPTPVQRRSIPVILEGQDTVAMARTGSGKTAAFVIPILERLKQHSESVGCRAVVLSPTRELALQTAKACRQLAKFLDLRICVLVGGQALEAQFEHLANNPDVLVCTPGRLTHHISEAELSLQRVEVLVFDEADRLFELGFAEQLQQVLEASPPSRQVLLFSATLPQQLVAFSRAGIKDPAFVRLDAETSLSEQLSLWYLFVRQDEKLAAAVAVLRRFHKEHKTTIMFVATKHHVEFFNELLQQLGLSVAVVYGQMDQTARQEQVARFRKKEALILVTTDVAARGVDIPLLDHVVNFDFPASAKLFIHRCGRTARAGRSGLAASLVTLDDLPYTVELMTFLGHKLRLPDEDLGTEDDINAASAPVLGAMPALDHEVEALGALLEEGSLLRSLQKSMQASYKLYYKTRPSASRASVARAKRLLTDCGGPAHLQGLVHPAFANGLAAPTANQAKASTVQTKADMPAISSDLAYLRNLRGYRPKAEKLGNVLSFSAMRTMEQEKLDAAAIASKDTQEAILAEPSASTPRRRVQTQKKVAAPAPQKAVKRNRPHLSKAARRRLRAGDTEETELVDENFDITVNDGDEHQKGEDGTGKGKTEQFYLSTERDLTEEARERGYDMEQYQMDLLPDDASDIKKAKSVMRWDTKKKKYLPTMVSVDGRALKGQRRNESGKKVKGEKEKGSAYQKWSQATKRRIQKVGEVEDPSNALGRLRKSEAKTVDFDEKAEPVEAATSRKPVVPFHGRISQEHLTHKQKRALKKRARQDSVAEGGGASELKTAQQIQQDKKLRDRQKLKQKPWLRKQRAKQAKETRMKKMEERQMKYGARTKAKMLIIEGPKRWTKRQQKPQKGYGRRQDF